MTLTRRLLKIIGSPFCGGEERDLPDDVDDAKALYALAVKNKIGLLF